MSYTPTEWASGDVITAEKLNKLENGVAEASSSDVEVVSITITPSGATLDKTYIEIDEAYKSGKMIFGKFIFGNNNFFGNIYVRLLGSENTYYFEYVSHTLSGSGSINWVSDTLNIVTVPYDGDATYEYYTYNHS